MSLIGLLNQTITIYAKSSYNDEGREVVGSGSDIKCRFQQTTKRRLLPNGNLQVIDAIVYVPGDTSINTDDKVLFGSTNYKVFSKYVAVDGAGTTDHIKLELVKWLST